MAVAANVYSIDISLPRSYLPDQGAAIFRSGSR
jgi:hypothetical protein